MAIDTYTPSFAETLNKVSKIKTKKEKVRFLRQYQTDALRMICKSSFDPKIVWELPEGARARAPPSLSWKPCLKFLQSLVCRYRLPLKFSYRFNEVA